jgi:hypothetical protein
LSSAAEVFVRSVRQLFTILTLLATSSAFGQLSMSIRVGKPDTPVTGLPFTADQSILSEQHLGNGMTLKHEIKGHLYRSSDGSERSDGMVFSTSSAGPEPNTMVFILDRAKHTATVLNTMLKTAVVERLPESAAVSVSFLPQPNIPESGTNKPVQPENSTTTDLGTRTQDTLTLSGRRVTGTIPVGRVGNSQPIQVTTETWVAPQFQLIVKQVDRNPVVGDRTFEVSNIHAQEPDPALFSIPEGYKVKEQSVPTEGLRQAPSAAPPASAPPSSTSPAPALKP